MLPIAVVAVGQPTRAGCTVRITAFQFLDDGDWVKVYPRLLELASRCLRVQCVHGPAGRRSVSHHERIIVHHTAPGAGACRTLWRSCRLCAVGRHHKALRTKYESNRSRPSWQQSRRVRV
jgi:hypothetical protein